MAILTASYLSQSFGALDLFSGVSVSIPNDGKIGLVGPNGIGKTTLLLILAGRSAPAAGQVNVAGNARIGYLPQESSDAFSGQTGTVYDAMLKVFADLRAAEAELRRMEMEMGNGAADAALLERYSKRQEAFELAGGYDYPVRIEQVLTGLGFTEEDWRRPLSHLSGGQKTRALLARLLLEAPDLLILDEPTNHLDVTAVEWLENTLSNWDGAVLVVSHDRYFLDKVVNTIWELTAAGVETYRGNYSDYAGQRQERWDQLEQAYQDLQAHLAKEMDFIRRNIASQRTQMAKGKLSRLAREVEAIHAGGLKMIDRLQQQGWAQITNEFELKRPAGTVGELHSRIQALPHPRRPKSLHMTLTAARRSGDLVLRTYDLAIGYPGDAPLFTAPDLALRRQSCTAFLGGNGVGKTTFLRTVLRRMPPLAGEIEIGASVDIGYFSQTQANLNPENRVLDELLGHHHMTLGEGRSYLAQFLFQGDDVYKRVGALSGGERNRLALAILSLSDANFLLLDEPTNHLDIPAQETLQAALEAYTGTVLLVTHDRYLVNRLATEIWEVRNGRLHHYAMPYQAYLAQREAEKTAEKERGKAGNGRVAPPPGDGEDDAGLSKNEQRRRAQTIARIEEDINRTEARLDAITQAIEEATQAEAFDKIQTLSIEYANREEELATLMEKWEKLHE